jgi:hypothetical protein
LHREHFKTHKLLWGMMEDHLLLISAAQALHLLEIGSDIIWELVMLQL